MSKNLVEAYQKRIAICEQVYSRSHNGEKLSNNTKLVTAKCLQNVEKFLNESFDNSIGTQRSDLGTWKKFCLNLTTVAVPNLIANDLVIVSPMSSMTGYITYIRYTAGSNKGSVRQRDTFNSPFGLGDLSGDRSDYTSSRVVESVDSSATTITPAWTPVIGDKVEARQTSDGAWVEVALTDGSATVIAGTYDKIRYTYDNVVIPQNDLPMVNAEIDSIPLTARARRVAVYYSQIAAYQAKTDFGFDLGEQLAEKAVGQLAYEIDTEVTNLLIDGAEADTDLQWSKTLPHGVSKTEHYEGFSEMIEIAKSKIYNRTKRFAPNYMLVASDILPVLSFIKGYTPVSVSQINGPYMAGVLNGIKVYVTPTIASGTFVIGVNGSDLMSSAAVYAPYMAIVPTQLLQYADGGTSQGWSTMYDLQLLNIYETAGHKYSNLLIKGTVTP